MDFDGTEITSTSVFVLNSTRNALTIDTSLLTSGEVYDLVLYLVKDGDTYSAFVQISKE